MKRSLIHEHTSLFVFLGGAGVLVGHPLDTVKVLICKQFALWKLERNLFFVVTGAPPNARFSEPRLQRDVSLLPNNHRERIGESSKHTGLTTEN